MSVVRCACFTLNNYTFDDLVRLGGLKDHVKYLVMGAEVGEQGTPHLQGYVEFNKSIRFNSAKKLLGDRVHIEQRRGTQQQAIDYCKKDGDVWEMGTPGNQGKRVDLDNVRQLAMDGGMRAVSRTSSLQQIKVAEKYLTYNEEPRDWKPEVYWLWGKTGVGKSRRAREIAGDQDTYCKNDGTKWWTGYDGHEVVIIDDFRDSWWSLTEMLSLLDRYEKIVEYKGGHRQFKPRTIIVTSAMSPEACYKNTGERIDQLLRRIDHIIECVADVAEVGEVILGLPDLVLEM